MYNTFKQHIETSFPFLKDARLLIAVSGGIDSMVLTHLCHQIKLDIALAHCNFNLRDEESDADEQFVLNYGQKIDKEVFTQHFNTKEYAKKHKLSIQMAARELRYEWFNDLSTALAFDYILTAHHADDNLETFIINLSRGTGLDGLTGIPSENDKIVRPLLAFSRQDILDYASEHKIEWREDRSNEEVKYLRNKIRHELVPVLKELHPQFLSNFLNSQKYLQGSSKILDQHIEEIKTRIFKKEGRVYKVSIADLLDLEPLPPYLHEFFKGFGFTQWDDIKDLLTAQSGKQLFSDSHRMLKDRGYLLIDEYKGKISHKEIYEITEENLSMITPLKLTFKEVNAISKEDESVIFVDKETLKFPLIVRKWEIGDYFYPYGLKGKKKLSKFFKDEKYSLIAKENQWLLCSGDDIMWVIRKRVDDRFKVTEKTNQILKIQIDQ
ncbi:tRNA lysidine(34) synthetase TilS [Flavobacteriaceae bacterium R38]|nr:tRNA lysidine(34) synthetase TilS [Flavobacteriaceae bacterium R38]